MIIAVDFDGTVVEHRFPKIGAPVPGAIDWLRRFVDAGAKLILLTMRSDGPPRAEEYKAVLSEAVCYLRCNGVTIWAVNENPEQGCWTNSRKVYAHLYIDDANAGCPLIHPEGDRPYVDWSVVGPQVMSRIEAENAKTCSTRQGA